MKVVHVTQATTGGTMVYLSMLLPRLAALGIDNEVVSPASGPLQEQLRGLDVRVTTVDMARSISPLRDARATVRLVRHLAAARPDVVYLHSSKAGAIGRVAARVVGLPSIYNAHGWAFTMDVGRLSRWLYGGVERLLASWTDRIINISDAEARAASDFGIPDGRSVTILNGTDPDRYRADGNVQLARARLNIPRDAFVVGMVARLVPQKAPLTVVRAAAELLARRPDYYFVLVGDGELRATVEETARALGVADRLRITGWTDDVAGPLAAFDVAVLSSAWEGFGLAVVEYMAACKPVVAAAVGGICDIVSHGDNGLLFAPGDAAALAAAVERLRADPPLRARLAAAGRRTACERFHIDRVARAHGVLFEEVVRHHRQRSGRALLPVEGGPVT